MVLMKIFTSLLVCLLLAGCDQIIEAYKIQHEEIKSGCLADSRFFYRRGICRPKDFMYYCENKNGDIDAGKQHTIDVLRSIIPGETCVEVAETIIGLGPQGHTVHFTKI